MEQTLTGLANSHSIYIQRLASSNVNEFNEEWGKYLRKLLAALDGYSEDLKRREFNRLISQISEVILENQELLAAGIELNLADFAEYETGYQVKSISTIAGVELATPVITQVIKAAQTRAISRSANDIINFNDWISDLSNSQQRRILTELRDGYRNGVTLQQMTQRIIGTRKNGYTDGIADIDRRSAVTLIRTATNHYATDAKLAVYGANADVIDGYRIVATLDSRTTDICRALDLTEYVYGEGDNPLPPFHANCLLGDTNVTSSSRVSNVYRRLYKGVIVDISTASDKKISITPNHPILTSRGWIAAGEINSADKVVTMRKSAISNHDENCLNATFEEIFSSLDVSVNPELVSDRPLTSKDFHGDVSIDHNVNVINTDSLSGKAIKSIVNKEVKDNGFILGFWVKLALNGFGSSLFFLNGSNSTPDSLMRCSSEICNLFWSGSSHSRKLLLASVPELSELAFKECDYRAAANVESKEFWNSVCANSAFVCINDSFLCSIVKFNFICVNALNAICIEKSSNNGLATAEMLGDGFNCDLIDGAHFDDVVDVSFREVDSLHVYNLENDVNWYLSNGIITHNCRTSITPIIKGINDKPRGQRQSAGDEKGLVSAAQDYYHFLSKQSAAFQDAVLGKAIGSAFRNSGLSVSEFARLAKKNFDKPMTIAEVASWDKKLLEYLK